MMSSKYVLKCLSFGSLSLLLKKVINITIFHSTQCVEFSRFHMAELMFIFGFSSTYLIIFEDFVFSFTGGKSLP